MAKEVKLLVQIRGRMGVGLKHNPHINKEKVLNYISDILREYADLFIYVFFMKCEKKDI